jgi:FkbM family methyltransferase
MLYSGKYIGKCFELYGQYSEAEVHVFRSFLSEGSVAFDIGANIGDLTLPMARLVGSTGRVFAVESNPDVFNVLCANLALNGIRNVRPVNAFLTSSSGDVEKIGAWGATAYVGDVWKPNATSLDTFDVPRCDFIKIDVDGPELSILDGGAMLIERHRPILYVENDDRSLSPRLLDLIMNVFGYHAYWHPAPIFDADNFAGNPVNQWAPDNIVSLMILAIPKERQQVVTDLQRVPSTDAWWRGMA